MKSRIDDIVSKYFIEKGELFRIIMDSNVMHIRAKKIAKGIAKQLIFMGIDKGLILDVGCGTGRIALELAELGYDVVGIDISATYIDMASKRAEEKGLDKKVEFRVCDARDIELCNLGLKKFDAVIFVWSSVIGYYDIETDVRILTSIKNLVKDNGVLLMVDFVNKEYIAVEKMFIGTKTIAYDYGDYLVLEHSIFNPITSELFIKQRFYRKESQNLIYIDDTVFKMRIYSLSEIVDIAKKSGWCLSKVLRDIEGEPGYTLFKPLNILFTLCKL